MDAQLEVKLIECLDALAQGESVERILARYPQEAAQLRPLLQTAAGLPALRMEPSEAVKMQSRQKFMAQADLLRRTPTTQDAWASCRALPPALWPPGWSPIVLGTGAVAASGSALPGDPLYGVEAHRGKCAAPARPAAQRSVRNCSANLNSAAVMKPNELLDVGREGEVEFTGPIESIQPNAWIVSGLVVQVDAQHVRSSGRRRSIGWPKSAV